MGLRLLIFIAFFMSGFSQAFNIIQNSKLNKGTSFTFEERKATGTTGLVPRGKVNILDKVENVMSIIRSKPSPIEKYVYLHSIQDAEESLYFAALALHTAELMPIVYTPTVGEACQKWAQISRSTLRGLYLCSADAGNIANIIKDHPAKEIDVIVFTDGERILGLGDLGVNGMGIPIGKLALYSALAGINPSRVLPVHIDVGTNNEEFLNDPLYAGVKTKRDRSPAYDALIKEFIEACQAAYGRNVLLQFEDFGNSNAFRLLDDFKDKATTFNDDIQGTASVAVAGLIAANKLTFPNDPSGGLGDHTYLFYGAGEAGVGIADLLCSEICNTRGITMEEARKQVYFMDSKGLVTSQRSDFDRMAHHKLPYAHDVAHAATIEECITKFQPTVLVGASAQPQTFTEPVVKAMLQVCKDKASAKAAGTCSTPAAEIPVVMALSNPTSKAECTAEQAYQWTNGECVFISGSPFDPVTLSNGKTYRPGQGNNAYIFPGLGLGAIVAKALTINDDDFLVAARTVAENVDASMLAAGAAYPPLNQLTTVSRRIAIAVGRHVIDTGRSSLPPDTTDAELEALCDAYQYDPFKQYL